MFIVVLPTMLSRIVLNVVCTAVFLCVTLRLCEIISFFLVYVYVLVTIVLCELLFCEMYKKCSKILSIKFEILASTFWNCVVFISVENGFYCKMQLFWHSIEFFGKLYVASKENWHNLQIFTKIIEMALTWS